VRLLCAAIPRVLFFFFWKGWCGVLVGTVGGQHVRRPRPGRVVSRFDQRRCACTIEALGTCIATVTHILVFDRYRRSSAIIGGSRTGLHRGRSDWLEADSIFFFF